MTFPEEFKPIMQNETRNSTNTGMKLKEVLLRANQDGRTTCGIYECAKLLNTNPDDVTLCILPVGLNNDVTIHIQHTLIEAFCLENEIKLVKVDSMEKLVIICSGNQNTSPFGTDCSCILITAPDVTDHVYNDVMDATDEPVIEMPV